MTLAIGWACIGISFVFLYLIVRRPLSRNLNTWFYAGIAFGIVGMVLCGVVVIRN